MSLFGSLMRDMERDPIFGAHSRVMNRMMGGMMPFGGGFGGMDTGLGLMGPNMGRDMMPFGAMNPFGFPNMTQMMQDPNSHSFSSMSVMSISSGPDGRPQVYQATNASRQGPGGVKETRKSVTDSRSGVKKMAVGRHLGERSHILEREENLYSGQREENEELINLAEEEAREFDREWRRRANAGYSHSASMPALASSSSDVHYGAQRALPSSSVTIEELPASDEEQEPSPSAARLALPPIPMVSSASSSHTRRSPHRRQKSSKRSKKY